MTNELNTNEARMKKKNENNLARKNVHRTQRKNTNINKEEQNELKDTKKTRVSKINDEKEILESTKQRKGRENRNISNTSETRARKNEIKKVKTNKRELDFSFKKSRLKIAPLGGLGEIGKNITIFEYEDEIVVVDCGLEFPEDDMLGVDLVIPDVTYLIKNKDRVKGIVITHGHEDHIGAIPYILKQINLPIYATKLTIELIKNKLEEHHLLNSTKLHVVEAGKTVNFGKIKAEFIRSSHSIPDAVMIAMHTPVGVVLHTGDFKVDYTPIDDKIMDLGRIAELGNNGILALLSDSTNSEKKGFTMSESSIGDVFDRLFQGNKKRIVVATFASNVHRVQQIVNSAVKYGRKIAVCGRSMINMIDAARRLGYIEVPDNVFIDIDMIKNYTDDQLVIITTGSQGETMSALTRMANGEHKKVTLTPNDMVIISATPIPGNERVYQELLMN